MGDVMLTPYEKIRRGGNDTIQIAITRSCSLYNCSNCTQLLPLRQDTLHMTPECFEEACYSVKDWPGIVALFGGNPCSSPHFDDICRIMCKILPDQRKRGLWTNDLLSHGAVARSTFWPHGRFNLNVHGNARAATEMRKWLPGKKVYGENGRNHHGMMLGAYQDYGYSKDQWVKMRERCDINQKWSSGIYQGSDGKPYAYFCEVAGSLSGIRGENHGIPAIPGWWMSPMSEFEHQVANCCDRGCAVPMRMEGHQDTADTYDVSPSMLSLTEKRTGKIVVECHERKPKQLHELTDYIGFRIPKK